MLSVSTLPWCRLSLLSSFFPRSQTQSWFPAWFTVLHPGLCSPVPSAPPWGAPGPVCPPWVAPVPSVFPLRLGGLQSRLLLLGAPIRLIRLGGLQFPSAPPWGSQSRLLRQVGSRSVWLPRPGGLQLPSDPPWLPHGPWPSSLPLFRLRSTAHLVMCRASGSRSLGGGYVTNPGHELAPLTHHMDFHTTQSVTDHSRTTFPIIHCTNTAVCTDHAHTCKQSPNHHHPITHTHTLHKPWTFSHSLRVLLA